MQDQCCKMLLEDESDKTRPRGCKYPTPPCALAKYYTRLLCAPGFVKSRTLRPLQTHFSLFQQIFFVVVCIHPGTPRVPPRVLASGPNPLRGNYELCMKFFSMYSLCSFILKLHVHVGHNISSCVIICCGQVCCFSLRIWQHCSPWCSRESKSY